MTKKAGQRLMKMKNNRIFILIESILAVLAIIFVAVMLHGNNKKALDKVAVVIQNSDDTQWAAFKYGLKMAAKDNKVEMFIVDTEGVMTAKNQKSLIEQEIDNGADAVIVQPVPGDDTQAMLKKIESHVPVMLADSTASRSKAKSELSTTEPNSYVMGKVLAKELLKDYSGNLTGKTLGIVSETEDSEASANRRKGFEDGVKNKGAAVVWSVTGSFGSDKDNSLGALPKADLVIALDDSSLTSAGECSATNDLHGAVVYGIGHSTEAIYYLDTDVVECLVVPDEFSAGYQSLTETAKCLQHHFRRTENKSVSYKVIRREELYSKENQELLFTMNQ